MSFPSHCSINNDQKYLDNIEYFMGIYYIIYINHNAVIKNQGF